jgi:inhibitor of cysteine peptidase
MTQKLMKISILAFAIFLFGCTSTSDDVGIETPSAIEYKRDIAYVDYDSTEIIVMESFPMQVALIIQGDLPTPCHELRWEVSDPDENKAIHVSVYSEVDASLRCAEMLESFEERIPLGDFEENGYSVWINDYEVGEF